MRTASEFFRWLRDKKVAFIGVGVSHNDLIEQFCARGARVTVCDRRPREQLGELADRLEAAGAALSLGADYLRGLAENDLVLRAPGVYWHLEELEAARRAGAVVTSEIELFFELCPCPITAVTGSDGKTTTTTLIAKLLASAGHIVHLGGNIGRALLPILEEIEPDHRAVVELSSFQLISMRRSPDVAVVTNIAPNHLDVHRDMDEYVDAKKNILLHQSAFSVAVLGADNALAAGLAPLARGKLRFFSRIERPEAGAYCDEKGDIFIVEGESSRLVMNKKDIKIPGEHNVENFLAAIAATADEVSVDDVAAVAKTFSGVEHRIELVIEAGGVRWYNDSIASSPTRAIAGLRAFPGSVILIAGGYDKKIPYEPMVPAVLGRCRALILLGHTADKIEAAVTADPDYDADKLPIYRVDNLEQAVIRARAIARDGDVVTLSPASASFDQYRNFEERGNHFKALVADLVDPGK